MENRTVSLSEASRRSGVSTTTLRRWLKEGKIKGQKSDRTYSLEVLSLIEFLPGNTWDTATATAPQETSELSVLTQRVKELTAENNRLEAQSRNDFVTVETLREALQALTMALTVKSQAITVEAIPAQKPKRRLFGRKQKAQ